MITIKKNLFGRIEKEEIHLFTITSSNNITVKISNFGGIVTSIIVPDREGKMEDVVLGFDELRKYINKHPYFGCIVGRYANRIANGAFSLDGKMVQLSKNAGSNHLHGGFNGFDKKIWQAKEFVGNNEAGVELTYTSGDGEEGYPGTLSTRVTYTLTNSMELKINYYAETDRPTCINLTNHSYFNLKGAGHGNILDHHLTINADRFTVVDDEHIPSGILQEVKDTSLDFTQLKPIGEYIDKNDSGLDHNFVLNHNGKLFKAAILKEPSSGRWLEVHTDQPGIQVYTANFLDGSMMGKDGKPYQKHSGICLETQHFPDSPNHPGFPGTILLPGQVFHSMTIYKFGITEPWR